MSVLSVQNLSKNYGVVRALNQVSFDVPKGSVYGILGPNGSGKTTLLGIVMDVLKANGGQFLWNGEPGTDAARRRQIGTLLETPNFYHYLSGERNLRIAAEIKGRGKEDIARVLDIVNLTQRKHSKFSTYSLGMKQRLAIASTLLGNPDVLVFDEPTNGLDPAGIAEIRQLMKKLNGEGKTIIMASHILDEVEKVCTHVAIIQKGVLKQTGTVQQILGGQHNTHFVELNCGDNERLRQVLAGMSGISGITLSDGILVAECGADVTTTAINQYCFNQGIVLSQLNVKRTSLETRFLEITGTQSDR